MQESPNSKFFIKKLVITYIGTIILLYFIFIGKLYYDWRKVCIEEYALIKLDFEHVFKTYGDFTSFLYFETKSDQNLELMIASLKRYCDVALSQKDFSLIRDIYYVTKDQNKLVYSRLKQAKLLPFLSFQNFFDIVDDASNESKIYYNIIDDRLLIGVMLSDEDSFIVLSVDLNELIKTIAFQLKSGEVFVNWNVDDNTTIISKLRNIFSYQLMIPVTSEFGLMYSAKSFQCIIHQNLKIIFLLLGFVIMSISICIFYILQVCKDNRKLSSNMLHLTNHFANCDTARIIKNHLYDDLILVFNTALFGLDNDDDNNIDFSILFAPQDIALEVILINCEKILYKELHDRKIMLKIECNMYSNLTKINKMDSLMLTIVIINYIYVAMIKTPHNGQILVKAFQDQEETLLTITDFGYDISSYARNHDQGFSLFNLSSKALQALMNSMKIDMIVKSDVDSGYSVILHLNKLMLKYKSSDIEDRNNIINFYDHGVRAD